jgi:hypothetical protein
MATPASELQPTFNPSNAPDDQIYAKGVKLPDSPAKNWGFKPHSELHPDADQVDIYRIVERDLVASGVGLVASRIVDTGSLGDRTELGDLKFKMQDHMASSHQKRVETGRTTPFVSFSSRPEDLADSVIGGSGFGVKDGSDSVVVHARVAPDRILSAPGADGREDLLVGGVSPEEYQTAYEIDDFVSAYGSPDQPVNVRDGSASHEAASAQQAVAYWRQKAAEQYQQQLEAGGQELQPVA